MASIKADDTINYTSKHKRSVIEYREYGFGFNVFIKSSPVFFKLMALNGFYVLIKNPEIGTRHHKKACYKSIPSHILAENLSIG